MPPKVKGLGWARYVALSPEAWLARQAELGRRRKKRNRAAKGLRQRRAARREDEVRCYAWERVSPWATVDPETGCWLWRGSYHRVVDRVQPVVRAGQDGKVDARRVVYELTHRKTLRVGCLLVPTCGRTECISPLHNVPTTKVQERARRKRAMSAPPNTRAEGHEP